MSSVATSIGPRHDDPRRGGHEHFFISALMFGGLPGAFLDLAILGAFTLVVSAVPLDELDEKLRLKFMITSDDAAAIRAKLENVAEIVSPSMVLTAIADDPDDNRVLECAVTGQTDYIVSGDRHLLTLTTYDGIPIMTVRQFLDTIEVDWSHEAD
jgi:putative PIN family toxin of toxin-antitoxin system